MYEMERYLRQTFNDCTKNRPVITAKTIECEHCDEWSYALDNRKMPSCPHKCKKCHYLHQKYCGDGDKGDDTCRELHCIECDYSADGDRDFLSCSCCGYSICQGCCQYKLETERARCPKKWKSFNSREAKPYYSDSEEDMLDEYEGSILCKFCKSQERKELLLKTKKSPKKPKKEKKIDTVKEPEKKKKKSKSDNPDKKKKKKDDKENKKSKKRKSENINEKKKKNVKRIKM